jgi:hypothetical protein
MARTGKGMPAWLTRHDKVVQDVGMAKKWRLVNMTLRSKAKESEDNEAKDPGGACTE